MTGMRAHLWLQMAGYLTWLVSGMPMLASVVRGAAAARMALLGVQAASGLVMAHTTIKNHASSILSKLGVRDRTRAVLKALELGYI